MYDFEDQRDALKVMDGNNPWFDNKRQFEPRPKKKQWQEMSLDELKSEYQDEKNKLTDLYDQFKIVPIDSIKNNISSVSHRMSIIMSKIKKVDSSFKIQKAAPVVPISKDQKKLIGELRNSIKLLEDQVRSKKEDQKLRRIELENNRQLQVHNNFKEIVKDLLGNDEYLRLIKLADQMADEE